MFDALISNVQIFSEVVELGNGSKDSVPRRQLFAGTDSKPAILYPPVVIA